MKKTSVAPNSCLRASNNSGSGIHGVSQRHKWSFGVSQIRKTSMLAGDSNNGKRNGRGGGHQTPRRAVQVFNEDGIDVTPLPLYHAEPGETQPKPGRFFLDEIFSSSGSDHLQSTSSFSVRSSSSFMCCSQPSSLSNKDLLTKDTEDNLPSLEMPINQPTPYVLPRKRDNVRQHMTEVKLDEVVDICFSETDTISLLDKPNTVISEDADDAEEIKKGNIHYAELCKNRMGNDKYVVRSMQTFNGAPKDKQIQCDKIAMVEEGLTATVWDIYDSFCRKNQTTESEEEKYSESTLNTSKIQENRQEKSNSTICTGSTSSSLLEMENYGNSLNVEPDPQWIMESESFQHSLLLVMRNIMVNIFQPKLAAYRQLPVLEDPDSTVKPGTKKQSEEGETSSLTPALECLWAFTCEVTRGRNITSMCWNKKDPNLLAVGYGDLMNEKEGLICCWSLKNPVWPECVFYCHSCVTCVDFSANNPCQLAVGMLDGTVALYNIQCRDKRTCLASSSECSIKHLHPVWQIKWTRQEMRLSGEERVEALVSVSADGRIKKWLLSANHLDCIDLMELKRTENVKPKAQKKKKKKKAAGVLAMMMPTLCIDFHPTDYSIYLTGTRDGLIHKCSFSNSQHSLDTYQKHFGQVNHVEWSPFSPDAFLSCSSDWTIQLWRQSQRTPVLSFTSTQKAVYTASWSPNHSTVFAAINGRQMEIWDLNICILNPAIVQHAAPGVKMTALLFATGSDCILVGDSDGQVTVYKPKNLSMGHGKQVDSLDDIIHSAVSRDQKV
ncbi:dynein axonemal intermediate chain 4-like isoform X2 [Seriola aureovittata]|uniref:dynein axonemal intermediate chain 4-like isoform X2 n=1 Tax=Seriola aureovittata TaxID=2871759 RepID=UPI0024BEB475|nr:dynein axonemal intermediate chain 4-like isoform X2 [Seriola aureovittata]